MSIYIIDYSDYLDYLVLFWPTISLNLKIIQFTLI